MFGDCHIHAVLDGEDFRRSIALHSGPEGPYEPTIRAMLAAYQYAGVTYLRDGGDRWGACMLAKRLAPEYGITYVAPGAPLFMKGNYGSFIGRAFEDIESYKALVADAIASGADFIKIMLSGIMDFEEYGRITGFTLDPCLVQDLVSIAHEAEMPVMAHVNGARAIQIAIEAGVDSIEHGYFSDATSRACLAESSTIWVPTLAPVANLIGSGVGDDSVLQHIVSDHMAAIRDVAAMGGTIAPGDDAGAHAVPHGPGITSEMALLSEALGSDRMDMVAGGLEAVRVRFALRRV